MKTIGYVRVSTSGQAQDGVSLSAQEAKIRAWSELNGADDVVIFTDAGLSGKRADNRPALQDALRTVGKGDALVVYSLSRLARSTKDTISIAETLDKRGADLLSLSEKIDTTTAAGKMVFRKRPCQPLLSPMGPCARCCKRSQKASLTPVFRSRYSLMDCWIL